MSYGLNHGGRSTEVSGVLRLESVEAYDGVLARARSGLASADAHYTLDLSGVSLMNSSGIRALANLVLVAKRHGALLTILGAQSVAWQRKTMASLTALYDRLEIKLV
jgi:hypothetical protein